MFPAKAIPRPSLTLLTHPEQDRDYVHFEHARDAPDLHFDATADTFSPLNAWWLADAALLSYWPSEAARKRFQDNGLFDDSAFIDQDGTQCYVAWTPGFIVVAFRGTQPDERVDIWHDVEFPRRAWDVAGEAVHEGFKEALDVAWPAVAQRLEMLPGRPAWFTGHSLGAALATLAADRHLLQGGQPAGVYTFGSPLVGDAAFVAGCNARHAGRSFRYVNHDDAVTNLPPASFGFGHVEQEKYIDQNGTIGPGPGRLRVADLLDRSAAHFQNLDEVLSGASLLPGFLIDHTPRRYAVLVWNALVAGNSL
jgi:triacylglycerol lipase